MVEPGRDLPVTEYLRALRTGDPAAAEKVLPWIVQEIRSIASRALRRERGESLLETTALLNEAWMRLAGAETIESHDRVQFLALAARIVRNVLTDYARERRSMKRGGGWARITLTDHAAICDGEALDVVDLDAALQRLSSWDERLARVVELRYFASLGVEETAVVLNVSPRTVKEDWRLARAFLRRELEKGRAAESDEH